MTCREIVRVIFCCMCLFRTCLDELWYVSLAQSFPFAAHLVNPRDDLHIVRTRTPGTALRHSSRLRVRSSQRTAAMTFL